MWAAIVFQHQISLNLISIPTKTQKQQQQKKITKGHIPFFLKEIQKKLEHKLTVLMKIVYPKSYIQFHFWSLFQIKYL